MKNKRNIKGKIGAEVEFWHSEYINNDILYSLGIYNEYYSGMYELNNFIQEWKSEKDIYNFFTDVVTKTKEILQKLDNITGGTSILGTKGISIDSHSMVFNGLHIHISFNDYRKQINLFQQLIKSNIIPNWKMTTYPSLRSISSHHIWGKYRDYEYSYKQRDKFVPVLWTDFNTIELRIFDNEDILVQSRRKKLSKFLFSVLSGENVGNVDTGLVNVISNGENLYAICKILESFNGFNHHRVVKHGAKTVVKNKCNEVVIDLDDNTLEVRK